MAIKKLSKRKETPGVATWDYRHSLEANDYLREKRAERAESKPGNKNYAKTTVKKDRPGKIDKHLVPLQNRSADARLVKNEVNRSPERGATHREQVRANRPQKKDIWRGMSTEQRLTAEYENSRRKRTRKY